MTREEAIAALKARCHYCEHFPTCVNDKPECFEAIDKAIRSIEALVDLEKPGDMEALIKSIRLYYEIAKNNDWIKHKVAWSLYQAWKDEDKKSKQ